MKNKLIIMLSSVVTVVAISGGIYYYTHKDTTKKEDKTELAKQQIVPTGLPSQAELKDQPLMEDFLIGYIGKNSVDDTDLISQSGTMVYVYSDKMDSVSSSFYIPKDRVGVLPNTGGKPQKSKVEVKDMKKFFDQYPEKYNEFTRHEKGYTFFFLECADLEEIQDAKELGIDYRDDRSFTDPIDGSYQTDVDKNGYPKADLNRDPYIDNLAKTNVHIEKPWWDTHNYGKRLLYIDGAGSEILISYVQDETINVTNQGETMLLFNTQQNTAEEKLEYYIKDNGLKLKQ